MAATWRLFWIAAALAVVRSAMAYQTTHGTAAWAGGRRSFLSRSIFAGAITALPVVAAADEPLSTAALFAGSAPAAAPAPCAPAAKLCADPDDEPAAKVAPAPVAAGPAVPAASAPAASLADALKAGSGGKSVGPLTHGN
eukprot:CAMPEP_0119513258 /NCGR_PEP_ID=MMETSP1344-20130328/31418_1 /TAXON_ID=236787 /ORGANISM="Florenciella parvula, Strain CCMP2471" /LENGTH=139 /DNA_ID=CAMNT_0007550457 /DNA_START=47 /DNA_END=466 /DNA_ORIENTATION=+